LDLVKNENILDKIRPTFHRTDLQAEPVNM